VASRRIGNLLPSILREDASDYARAIDGKTWEELDTKYIVRRNDALGFLSTHQLVQLLPVYPRSLVNDGVMSPGT